LEGARREFFEETGKSLDGAFIDLGEVKSGGKIDRVFAIETDLDTDIRSNTFTVEWPPGSGRFQKFPEIDKAAWIPLSQARELVFKRQLPFLDRLEAVVEGKGE